MNKVHLILAVLERVPAPYVPQAAAAIDAVITAIHDERAAEAKETASSLEEWRVAVKGAAEANESVWARIRARAAGDSRGEVVTGSTGE